MIENNIERGYIAGFFDAEGMIRVENGGTPSVTIKQTYRPVLEYISSKFPGSITRYVPKDMNRKVSFRLIISLDDQIRFLEYIYPCLIEKRKQAELMLYYLKQIKSPRRDYFRLSNTQRQQREWIVKELERLKQEKYNDIQLKDYDNELKKQRIPKDIREGKQSTLIPLEDTYKELGIYETIDESQTTNINVRYIPDMSEYSLTGYITGFFDGEGYIGIVRGKRDSYTLRVATTNSNFDILNIYQDRYGGKIRPKTDKDTKEHYKKLWLWETHNNVALSFLERIYPYMIVKKDQSINAIRFQKFHNSIGVINTNQKKVVADQYLSKIKELKKDIGENESNNEEEKLQSDNNSQKSIVTCWE